jgi:hypothetical protein
LHLKDLLDLLLLVVVVIPLKTALENVPKTITTRTIQLTIFKITEVVPVLTVSIIPRIVQVISILIRRKILVLTTHHANRMGFMFISTRIFAQCGSTVLTKARLETVKFKPVSVIINVKNKQNLR